MQLRALALLAALLLPAHAFAANPYGATHTTDPPANDSSQLVPSTHWIAANTATSFMGRQGAISLLSADVSTALGFTPAPLASPAFTGTPTAPTPTASDSSTKAATTAYVNARGPSFGTNTAVSTSTTLTASNVGQMVIGTQSAPITVTLPAAASAYNGAGLGFYNFGTANETIVTQGSDQTARGTSVTLIPGASWVVEASTAGYWRTVSQYDNSPFNSAVVAGAIDNAISLASSGVTIAAGSNVLTAVGASFASTDVGKAIIVPGAGAAVAAPAAVPGATFNLTGGTLAAGTYYVEVTYTTPNGETVASPEATFTATGATGQVEFATPTIVSTATGWNIYIGTTSGGETLQNSTPIPTGMYYVAQSLATGAAAPPGASTAGNQPLVTTISAWNSATSVNLTANAAAAVTGADEGVTYGPTTRQRSTPAFRCRRRPISASACCGPAACPPASVSRSW